MDKDMGVQFWEFCQEGRHNGDSRYGSTLGVGSTLGRAASVQSKIYITTSPTVGVGAKSMAVTGLPLPISGESSSFNFTQFLKTF